MLSECGRRHNVYINVAYAHRMYLPKTYRQCYIAQMRSFMPAMAYIFSFEILSSIALNIVLNKYIPCKKKEDENTRRDIHTFPK